MRLPPPFRIVLRNLVFAALVALPVVLVSGAVASWLMPPDWANVPSRASLRFGRVLEGLVFWYAILIIPTLVLTILHQLFLASLPHTWSVRRTRIIIIVSTACMAALIGLIALDGATETHYAVLVVALGSGILVYGFGVRPLGSDA